MPIAKKWVVTWQQGERRLIRVFQSYSKLRRETLKLNRSGAKNIRVEPVKGD